MKIKEIAKQLANKINQEHYIMHYLEKIQRGAYNKGFKDGQEQKLILPDVGQPLFCDTCKTNVSYWPDLDRHTCNCGRTIKAK